MATTHNGASRLAPERAEIITETTSRCPDCVAEQQFDTIRVPMVVYEADNEIRLANTLEENPCNRPPDRPRHHRPSPFQHRLHDEQGAVSVAGTPHRT